MTSNSEFLAIAWPQSLAGNVQAVLNRWIGDLEKRDGYTGRHSGLATRLAVMLSRRLRLDSKTDVGLWVAGHVYDLGKIAVPEPVLRKTGSLSDAEHIMMRQHVTMGYDLLRDWELLREAPRWLYVLVLDVVRYHHERWDGAGYPDGRRGEATPLEARIMAIADAYAAMTMDSPYRHAFPVDWALAELKANAGAQFDPQLVPAFASAVRLALHKTRQGPLGLLETKSGLLVPGNGADPLSA